MFGGVWRRGHDRHVARRRRTTGICRMAAEKPTNGRRTPTAALRRRAVYIPEGGLGASRLCQSADTPGRGGADGISGMNRATHGEIGALLTSRVFGRHAQCSARSPAKPKCQRVPDGRRLRRSWTPPVTTRRDGVGARNGKDADARTLEVRNRPSRGVTHAEGPARPQECAKDARRSDLRVHRQRQNFSGRCPWSPCANLCGCIASEISLSSTSALPVMSECGLGECQKKGPSALTLPWSAGARYALRSAALPHVFTSCQTPLLLRDRS